MGRSDDLTFVYGAVISDDAARLELRYADGTAKDVPLTWVSPPIDAGFYFVEIPPEAFHVVGSSDAGVMPRSVVAPTDRLVG